MRSLVFDGGDNVELWNKKASFSALEIASEDDTAAGCDKSARASTI